MAGAVRENSASGRRLAAAVLAITFVSVSAASGQTTTSEMSAVIRADQPGATISRNIFGQFAEQLGEGIYGGVWVGADSKIPNVRGIRSDVVQALRTLHVPDLRWPGGCFADTYHWRNGVGAAGERPATYNINWGSPVEPNTFGTHEFMDFIQQIGSEAYLTVNVGTGSVQEAADWLEYMTADQPTALTHARAANGRTAPWRVKFLGIGNESWGCGGAMSPQDYVERLKSYSVFVRNLNPAQNGANKFSPGPDPMQRIAVGASADDTAYTTAVMQAWAARPPRLWDIEGLSLHAYTGGPRGAMRDPATGFGEADYAIFVKNAYRMDQLIAENSAIMDRFDPTRKVALVVDEWGVWLQPMPGTPPLNLKQQNSLRDAIVASLTLDIFAHHAERVRMANIAQMVNVLQAMILTDGDRMLLTPTYHVFRMYVPFQDATSLPLTLERGEYRLGATTLPQVDGMAARGKDGRVWLALTNLDPNRAAAVAVTLPGGHVAGALGEVLTASRVDAVNTFEAPDQVIPRTFSEHAANGKLVLHLPPASVAVVHLQ